MGVRRVVIIFAFFLSLLTIGPAAQQSVKGGINSIQQEPLKEWLTYIASDELQGRATYSEGLGLAAKPLKMNGAVERSRTSDLLITNQLLYQLSYNSTEGPLL